MIVVDASVLAPALGDDFNDGQRARASLTNEHLFAPEIIDLEVISIWRRSVRGGKMTEQRADQALTDLYDLPLQRAPHKTLVTRIWELRNNLTPYDAAYVALAEALEAPLVTADSRLANATGIRCEVSLIN